MTDALRLQPLTDAGEEGKAVGVRPRVVHWTFSCAPETGGVATYIGNIVGHLREYDFEIITDRLPDTPHVDRPYPTTIVRRSRPTDRTRSGSWNLGWKLLMPYAAACDAVRIWRQRRYIVEAGFDLLHVHDLAVSMRALANHLGWPLIAKLRARLVRLHTFSGPRILTKHFAFRSVGTDQMANILFAGLSEFDHVICLSPDSVQEVKSWYSDELPFYIWHIPNGVDVQLFNYQPLEPSERLKVGFVGRLDAAKGERLLLELLDQWPDNVELHLAVAMTPHRVRQVLERVGRSGVKVEVDIPHHRMPGFYHNIDVLLNLTVVPAADQAILEAMACGRAVIRIDVGDTRPIVHGETGYITPPDAASIRELLCRIASRPDELDVIGRAAREVVERHHSVKEFAQRISEVYQVALGHR